jgi:cell division protein FtsB
MFEKIKIFRTSKAVRMLTDIKGVGLIIFGVIVLLVSWSGVKVIQTNYDLQKQISGMQQQNDVQTLENNNLKLKNQYLKTDQYLELAARQHFNKALPGEKLLVVPKSIALQHTVDVPKPSDAASQSANSPTERNFNAWLDFFFHRQSS